MFVGEQAGKAEGAIFINSNFRNLLASSALSNFSDGLIAFTVPWIASILTRDPILIACVAFATRLPWLVLSLPVGVITDRIDRRLLLSASDAARCGFALLLTLYLFLLPKRVWSEHVNDSSVFVFALVGFALLLGAAEVIRDSVAQTILPSIVKEHELERSNGRLWSVEQITGSLIGPPVAGLLIALTVTAPSFLAAIMFAISFFSLLRLRLPKGQRSVEKLRFYSELTVGFQWLLAHRFLLRMAVILGLLNALAQMTITILVLYSQEVLRLVSAEYGFLLTAFAAGGIVGGFVCPIIVKWLGRVRSLYVSLIIIAVSFFSIYITQSALVVACALFLNMFASVLWNVVTVSYRQRVIPTQLLGRVNSIYRFFGWGMMPIGALLGGIVVTIAESFFPREVAVAVPFLLASIGSLLILIYVALRLEFDSTF